MDKSATALTERLGLNAVEEVFLSKLGWFFREQAVSDFGVDAQAEIIKEGKPTGRLLALQVKSGPSYFKKRGADYVYHGSLEHLEYWSNHSLPVFIILHNPVDGMTLWQRIDRHLVDETDKGWSITVPAKNVLDATAKEYLAAGISNDPAAIKRSRFVSDKAFMKTFEDREVFFSIDVWVNKSLSIRGIQVYYDDHEKYASDLEIPVWAAYHTVHDVMSHFYPWITYSYAEFMDADQGAGEIECHVFDVKLNEAAEMFLKLEDFYQSKTEVLDPPMPGSEDEEFGEGEFDEAAFRRAVARDNL